MKITQKLNLELHHLWYALEDLQYHPYPKEIEEKIKDLQLYVEKKLFNEIPSGFDIVDDECVLITSIEKPKFSNN